MKKITVYASIAAYCLGGETIGANERCLELGIGWQGVAIIDAHGGITHTAPVKELGRRHIVGSIGRGLDARKTESLLGSLENTLGIDYLCLIHCDISEACSDRLAKILGTSSYLTRLTIDCSSMTDQGFRGLWTAVENNTVLTSIALDVEGVTQNLFEDGYNSMWIRCRTNAMINPTYSCFAIGLM